VLFSLLPFLQAVTYGTFYPVEEMTDLAQDVVSGTVNQIASKKVDGKIVSTITVDITHNYVGNKQNQLQFDVLGGTYQGITMSVPGAPQFEIGQNVLVFVDAEQIIGFGQGAYTIDSNEEAVRGDSNRIPESANTLNLEKELPDETSARSCLEIKVWNDYPHDWSLRSLEVDHIANSEIKAYPLTLLEGLEYQFIACSDEKADGVSLSVYDEEGKLLEQISEDGREIRFEWKAEETQDIYLSVEAHISDKEVKQVGTSLGILYR
jgi:hypothetical protein